MGDHPGHEWDGQLEGRWEARLDQGEGVGNRCARIATFSSLRSHRYANQPAPHFALLGPQELGESRLDNLPIQIGSYTPS